MTPVGIQSYSQREEQRHILETLSGIERGTLLDIGAWSATKFSNSRALIEMGWKAVLVEPSPGPLRELVKEYGAIDDVILVGGLVVPVTRQTSLLGLHVSDDGVSTTEESEYKKWRKTARFEGSVFFPGVLLESLYRFSAEGKFDFVSIDTEGTSVDLFADLMAITAASRHRQPRCVCVEHNERRDEVYFAFRGRYQTVYQNTENLVLEAL